MSGKTTRHYYPQSCFTRDLRVDLLLRYKNFHYMVYRHYEEFRIDVIFDK